MTSVLRRHRANHIGDELGVPAYALYTDALVGAMGLADPTTAGMRAYRETFESVGEMAGWVTDLGAAWEAEQRRVRTKVTDDEALAVITIPAAVPREILWEWTTSPARRIRWTSGMTGVTEDLANGRRGIGTVNHCAHGKNVSIEEVVDWVPPEYETKRVNTGFRGVPRILITTELVARGPGQTDLVYRVARPRSVKDRLTGRGVTSLGWSGSTPPAGGANTRFRRAQTGCARQPAEEAATVRVVPARLRPSLGRPRMAHVTPRARSSRRRGSHPHRALPARGSRRTGPRSAALRTRPDPRRCWLR